MDEIRTAFWESFRHLFPPHARAMQTGSGGLMISWALQGDPHARFDHATPITIRFEEDLLEAMRQARADQRGRSRRGTSRRSRPAWWATTPTRRCRARA